MNRSAKTGHLWVAEVCSFRLRKISTSRAGAETRPYAIIAEPPTEAAAETRTVFARFKAFPSRKIPPQCGGNVAKGDKGGRPRKRRWLRQWRRRMRWYHTSYFLPLTFYFRRRRRPPKKHYLNCTTSRKGCQIFCEKIPCTKPLPFVKTIQKVIAQPEFSCRTMTKTISYKVISLTFPALLTSPPASM